MKKLFKIASLIGFVITFVIFGIVFLGESKIPNEIHIIDESELNDNGIFSFKNLQAKDYSLSANSKVLVPANNENFYNVEVSAFNTIPIKQSKIIVSKRKYVVPSGDVFGIRLFTKGVMIVGMDDIFTEISTENPGKSAGIKVGDIITAINGATINKTSEISAAFLENQNSEMTLTLTRNNQTIETKLTLAKSKSDGTYKAGLWVRDSTAGVGTLTYYIPQDGVFGGLGHAVCDVDTGNVMPLGDGDAVETVINGCYKGTNGVTGELCGLFRRKTLGTLLVNGENGVYGVFDKYKSDNKEIPVATKQEVKLGDAQIIATVDESGPKYYNIKIVKIYPSTGTTGKNMIVEVADSNLIEKTGGIVQGMSGSPIIQNGMLVGAVTHVFVNNPLQGYAIFAENM
ncbi:MAG: SpoIVB peptidase, partial [Oscillospiraceae bacterium]